MKNFKKIASAIAALSLAACMVAPVATMTSFAVDNNSVIITTNSNGTHTYGLYQIFDGELSDGSLINIEWGAAFDGDGETFLTNLKADGTLGSVFGSCNSAKDVADVLGSDANKGEDSTVAKQFADFTGKWLKTNSKTATYTSTASGENTVTVAGVADGYYLVQDESSPDAVDGEENAGAMTRFVLQVIGDTSLSVTTKQTAPSVDKLVLDESADAESSATAATESGLTGGKWGETADHAIGETFQFKLTAEMTGSKELDEYKRYTLKFSDTMATGVTYESIASVKIIYTDGTTTASDVAAKDTDTNKDGYDIDFPAALAKEGTLENTHKGDGTTAWTLTIPDLKKYLAAGKNLSDVKSVEVVYNAHLNDEAIVVNSDVDVSAGSYGATSDMKVNINKVDLEYSNNPNKTDWGAEGESDEDTGKTPPDTVGVFTYKVTSTKVDGASLEGGEYKTKLKDAVFSLYAKDPKAEKEDNAAIKLVEVKKGANTLGYRLATKAEAEVAKESGGVWVTEITTPANGEFVFYGLDAGTYYIDEVTAPSGYNKLEKAIKVDIVATHAEVDDGSATLNLSTNSKYDDTAISSAIEGNIENNKGATLPSTGGIGTTLFYLGGGALVAVAGVMLITKKRMTKE